MCVKRSKAKKMRRWFGYRYCHKSFIPPPFG